VGKPSAFQRPQWRQSGGITGSTVKNSSLRTALEASRSLEQLVSVWRFFFWRICFALVSVHGDLQHSICCHVNARHGFAHRFRAILATKASGLTFPRARDIHAARSKLFCLRGVDAGSITM